MAAPETELCAVLTTAPDEGIAAMLARTLVEERLAACVNIIDGMNSIYRWEGKIMQDTETVLIAKTVQDKVSALTERVKALHSYDCPCVVALPIRGGNELFLNWVAEEVR